MAILAPIQEERTQRLAELDEERKKAGVGEGTEFGKGGIFDNLAIDFEKNADIIANAMDSQEKAQAELTNITNKLLADMLDEMRADKGVKEQTDEIRALSDEIAKLGHDKLTTQTQQNIERDKDLFCDFNIRAENKKFVKFHEPENREEFAEGTTKTLQCDYENIDDIINVLNKNESLIREIAERHIAKSRVPTFSTSIAYPSRPVSVIRGDQPYLYQCGENDFQSIIKSLTQQQGISATRLLLRPKQDGV